MSTNTRVCVLALALGGVAACSGGDGSTQPQPTTGSIAGRVAAANEGVAGAAIALSGGASRTTTTDDAGEFRFADLAPGAFSLALTLPDGFRLAANESLTMAATVIGGQSTTVNWNLEPLETGPVREIRLSGVAFSPGDVTIDVGTTVRWVVDEGSHTVTPDDPNQAGVWTSSGPLGPGQTFSFQFASPGVYPYHCVPHRALGMTGTIRVQE